MGIFGSCQYQAQANANNIETLEQYSMALTDYVSEIETSSNEKFFAISNELSEIRAIQQQTIENQNWNWKILEKQFATIQGNFNILRNCTQTLFSKQHFNFNFDTAASLLNVVYADITSYKTALYAFKTNDTNSAGPTTLDVSCSAKVPFGGHRRRVQKPKGGKPPIDPCDTAKRYPLILWRKAASRRHNN